jgi:hypothetical protein
MGRGGVADVGDRWAAGARWRRHSPPHHNQLPLVARVAHHRRGIVRKYARHRRQIAEVTVHHAKERTDNFALHISIIASAILEREISIVMVLPKQLAQQSDV